MPSSLLLRRLAWTATVFALCVIVFGAFVRLSNAGLSCPDWPTCYGKATWPGHEHEIAHANANFDRPVETHRAWREQVHRMIAGTLGLLVLGLAVVAAWRRWRLVAVLGIAALAAACAVRAYMQGAVELSGWLAALGMALPLLAAWRLERPAPWRIAIVAFSVIIFQAMLGMWTVTWLLKPVIVMAHLLGGLLTLVLLGYVALAVSRTASPSAALRQLRPMVVVGLVLLAAQIALGGWVSANYAALSCGLDFPTCQGRWWPPMDFREGFVLWRGIGVNYEGGILDGPARTAIQMTHRIGALIVLGHVGATAWLAVRRGERRLGLIVGGLLCLQVALGIGNVLLDLPLPVATAHNGVAALLLLSLLALLVRTRESPASAA
ncbi:COX15/CtaA family protein [Dokdonella koreensis]|uniref:Cytochrome oxidase assembly protein n=1 Tax=Dokdonella koreensis DS-123 TaxID=1300342 RepID=A0A167H5Z2_9GAMM|nr:COX15/CtaA family protein [Dokdonella koreensis]ANB19086.1 Cytochrome oxidase assembly protein [Dokdonella koreensis DS-123]